MNTVMKQALVITTFSAAMILTGCGKSKPEPKSKQKKSRQFRIGAVRTLII